MIKLFSVALAILLLYTPVQSFANEQPKFKKVCIKVLDNKSKKQVLKCKQMRIHKKHNGTVVPKGSKK